VLVNSRHRAGIIPSLRGVTHFTPYRLGRKAGVKMHLGSPPDFTDKLPPCLMLPNELYHLTSLTKCRLCYYLGRVGPTQLTVFRPTTLMHGNIPEQLNYALTD
jgi:hypothetical protein